MKYFTNCRTLDELKKWSSNKKMWYWHHAEDGAHWSRGKKTMNQIRQKYGSQTFAGTAAAAQITA